MKIRSSEITMSAINRSQYPADGIPEIIWEGRWNMNSKPTIMEQLRMADEGH